MGDEYRIADEVRRGQLQDREPEPYKPHHPWKPEVNDLGDWSEQFAKREEALKRARIAERENIPEEKVHPDQLDQED